MAAVTFSVGNNNYNDRAYAHTSVRSLTLHVCCMHTVAGRLDKNW